MAVPIINLIASLKLVLEKLKSRAAYFRERYGNLSTAPGEFIDEVLPALVEATGDPGYALRLAERAWAGIVSGETTYSKHHGGAS